MWRNNFAINIFLNFFFVFWQPKETKVFGEMAEWSKAHAWKVCYRQKRYVGSNPPLSAEVQKFGFLLNV
jgi:hypothetical protein